MMELNIKVKDILQKNEYSDVGGDHICEHDYMNINIFNTVTKANYDNRFYIQEFVVKGMNKLEIIQSKDKNWHNFIKVQIIKHRDNNSITIKFNNMRVSLDTIYIN